MDYQIIELEEFSVIGIRYELSKSLSNNVKLAQNHWKMFNSKLRNNKLYLGSNWCKYAFIEKIENKIFYYISIPKKDFVPDGFIEKTILIRLNNLMRRRDFFSSLHHIFSYNLLISQLI